MSTSSVRTPAEILKNQARTPPGCRAHRGARDPRSRPVRRALAGRTRPVDVLAQDRVQRPSCHEETSAVGRDPSRGTPSGFGHRPGRTVPRSNCPCAQPVPEPVGPSHGGSARSGRAGHSRGPIHPRSARGHRRSLSRGQDRSAGARGRASDRAAGAQRPRWCPTRLDAPACARRWGADERHRTEPSAVSTRFVHRDVRT